MSHQFINTIEKIMSDPDHSHNLQRSIMELLNWREEDFQGFVFETGLAYLEAYFLDDQDAINQVKIKREFWNWFKNHWTYRDQVFLETFYFDASSDHQFRLKMYQALHQPEVLACEIYPSRVILGSQFSTIKKELSC